jgi:RNA polymerase sigma-70 factor (ECF subfamily)
VVDTLYIWYPEPDGKNLKPIVRGEPLNQRKTSNECHAGFERMAIAYGSSMLKFAAAQLGGRQLAEDAVQEALIKLYMHSDKFMDTDYEYGYVMRTVLNACRDIQRSTWYKKVIPSIGGIAARTKSHDAAHGTLMESINRLEPRIREALLVRHYLGFSTKDTAQMLGVSEGIVRERLRKAKSQLPKMMKESGFNDEF